MWWVVGIHVSLSTEMKVLNFHGLYSSMYHLLVCKFQICLTCTLSDAFSSCSPIRSTIFLSWFMYFWAVFKTQGGNVALNRSVWGLSSLAEKQMVINIKNNQFLVKTGLIHLTLNTTLIHSSVVLKIVPNCQYQIILLIQVSLLSTIRRNKWIRIF